MLKKLLQILSTQDKWRLTLLVIASVITSAFGVAGVGSIMPFMTLLGNPGQVHRSGILSYLYRLSGAPAVSEFLVYLGVAVILVFLISNVVIAINTWLSIRFSRTVAFHMTRDLFASYVGRQYDFYLNRNPSELSKNVFGEASRVVMNIVQPGVDLIARGLLAVGVLVFLIALNPLVAVVMGAVLGLFYTAIYRAFRPRLHLAGEEAVRANRQRFGVANEAFGGIKDIKLLGIEESYSRRFDGPEWRFERANAVTQTIQVIPKYILEGVAYGGILAVALYLFTKERSFSAVFPLISAYALGGYRLMPALQSVFSGIAGIRGSEASLNVLFADLHNVPVEPETSAVSDRPTAPAPRLTREIVLADVTFGYGRNDALVAREFNLRIEANTTVGLVGPTGCGKTTIVDIILGLLEPGSGELCVDGIVINRRNVREWRSQLGYVPQAIYIADDTVAKNIAFGVVDDELDMMAVRRAASIADIDSFVTEELEHGYDTVVGDRGIRLSGGQRQRIAIARALYRDPAVVVMDEATSALDNVTEHVVIDAIENIAHTKTVIMVAHRLTTLRECDVIHVIDSGRIVDSGTYEDLRERNSTFRRGTIA